MRLVASAVLATLVTLILFYAMQSMITAKGRPPEKPGSAGLRLVQVDQVKQLASAEVGKRSLPPPPSPSVTAAVTPALSFEPAAKPKLPPPAAAMPDLPAIKPGAKPYLGSYLKPSKPKTSPLPPPKTPVKSLTSKPATRPDKANTRKHTTSTPQQATPAAASKVPPSSRTATNSTANQVPSAASGHTGSGTAAASASGSGSLTGSPGHADGRLEEEVVALLKTAPKYPRKAARSGKQGWVKIEFTITAQGEVVDPKVIASKPRRIFDRAALKAIKQWRFKPKMVDGKAVPRRAVQVIEFKLATG